MAKTNIYIQELARIGAKGGRVTGGAKAIAAKFNGQHGGRPKKIYIYGLLNLDSGQVEYIGQTRNVRQRFNAHICRGGRFRCVQFPIGVVILCVTDESRANEAEEMFWRHYKKHGEAKLNGKQFRDYKFRNIKWLKQRGYCD